jgi:hypothetical protein
MLVLRARFRPTFIREAKIASKAAKLPCIRVCESVVVGAVELEVSAHYVVSLNPALQHVRVRLECIEVGETLVKYLLVRGRAISTPPLDNFVGRRSEQPIEFRFAYVHSAEVGST